jgi:hypothetical protein
MGETLWRRLFRGARRLHQQPRWAEFAGPDWPDRIMGLDLRDRFHAKQGRTIVRWALEAGGRRLAVYLKRHYRLPWWRGLLSLLWPGARCSPGLEEWDHLQWARAEGLPVPEAVAAGEFIGPWGRLQSFIAVEELAGMLPLHQAVPLAACRLPPGDFRRWKRGLAAEMADIVVRLHGLGRYHKDLYLCHFYVAETDTARVPDWPGRVRLIDLHRLGHHPWTGPWWRAKDLGQLLFSSDVPGVTDRDRFLFWCFYTAGWPRGLLARLFRAWVRLKARGYHRRHRRRAG